MTAMTIVEQLLQKPLAKSRSGGTLTRSPSTFKGAAEEIVQVLLGEARLAEPRLSEASVHRPNRSRVWVAAFTGPVGGPVQRSTGLTDRTQALLVARQWEAEARAERARLGHTTRKPVWRVPRSASSTGHCRMTQKEVALLLGMSERAVRAVERRAFEKLRRHPLLRQVWRQFPKGELDEYQQALTPEEADALLKMARTPQELHLLRKVLRVIDGRHD